MKRLAQYTLSVLFFFVSTLFTSAQIYDPVDWEWEVEYLGDGKADIVFTASVEDHWHIYSIDVTGGPLPTEFKFEETDHYELNGGIRESDPVVTYDPNFEVELGYHNDGATFRQTVKLNKKTKIKGYLSYMVCNDEMCLPPEYVDFEIGVDPAKSRSSSTPAVQEETPEIQTPSEDNSGGDPEVSGEVGQSEDSDHVTEEVAVIADTEDTKGEESSKSIWIIFLEGFGGGLAALLMPCIFPMIPLTVSFFTKQSKTRAEGIRKAIVYGLSINAIYVSLGLIITIAFGSDALNAMSTDPYFNFAFFLLFVVFAISFFGAFEITLPSSWVNKADAASSKGGMLGIFFMAFTLSIVSFSCTGPIIGTLLVDAASKGEVFGPAMGMLGFSLALSLPFMLFAAFPGWMNSLPKSGGWLNTVKVTLGFLELGFAMKFFSTADLVLQLHWLEREVFMAVWVGIAFIIALYLLGVFRMPHDSPLDKIGVGRMMVALFFFIFGFYMLPGIWGAPVKLIAGFPPPQHYSESPGGSFAGSPMAASADETVVEWGEHCPPGINCFNDLEEGLKYAESVGRPIMLDFTGWGCVNCRKMEEQVWSDPGVIERLNNSVVLISLYVDERIDLPVSEQYVSEFSGKKITKVGQKWSDFEATEFGTNAQPYYVILNHDSYEPLNGSAAYDPDIQKFKNWIDEGVGIFESQR